MLFKCLEAQRALPLCGGAACSTTREAEHCTAVQGTIIKTYFSPLKKALLKHLYLFNCKLYSEHFLCFTRQQTATGSPIKHLICGVKQCA